MHRGYTCLWRKIWSNPVLIEPKRRFSRLEAWLYITNALAAEVEDPVAGLKRGEFAASIRQCAECFHWSRGTTERFLELLLENSMIMRVEHSAGHPAGQEAGHFSVCNYETYNPPRDAGWNTGRDTERCTENRAGHDAEHFSVCNHDTCSPPRYTGWDTERQGVCINNNIYNNKNNKDTPAFAKASAGKPVPAGQSFSEGRSPKILLEIYQQHNQALPEVKALTAERLRKCRSRVNQAVRDGCLEQYLADFLAAVKKAQQTPFLRGEGTRGWRASFDWFVTNQVNVYAVLEGKYDGAVSGLSKENGGSNGGSCQNPECEPGGTSSRRTSRGDLIYVPRQ